MITRFFLFAKGWLGLCRMKRAVFLLDEVM